MLTVGLTCCLPANTALAQHLANADHGGSTLLLDSLKRVNEELSAVPAIAPPERASKQPIAGSPNDDLPMRTILFCLVAMIGGAIAVSRIPQTWQEATADQKRRGAKIAAMSRLNALLGCVLALAAGVLAAPVMIATIVDLLSHGVRRLFGA